MQTKVTLILVTVLLLAACAPRASPTPSGTLPQISNSSDKTFTPVSSKTASISTSETPSSSPDPESTTSLEALSGEAEIEIENFAYTPKTITIKAGTTVKWSNKDDSQHKVVADDGSWSSSSLSKGDSFSFTFTQAGTFTYHCGFHSSMTGTVVVVSP